MTKLLVLFVFHIYNERVKSFINKAIFYDKDIDFIVISNNKNIILKVPNYVKILNRDNIGYDFGGWSDALLINNLYKNYDNFIFVNSSVIGPFLSSNYKGKWTDKFLDGLKNDIKLFGSTLCCFQPLTHSHVQSNIFSMDKNTLQYLIDCHIFSITNYAKTFNDAVFQKEVLMSRKIIENNWNFGSLMLYYKDIDFRFRDKKPGDYNIKFIDDMYITPFIEDVWTNKEELVFIKGNRLNIGNNILKSWIFIGNENDTVSVSPNTKNKIWSKWEI